MSNWMEVTLNLVKVLSYPGFSLSRAIVNAAGLVEAKRTIYLACGDSPIRAFYF